MRIAAIGDCHGCPEELRALYLKLEWQSLDAIYHLGDLVDRGPDSGAVVQFCAENEVLGIKGNHESVLLERYDRLAQNKEVIFNPEKDATISQIRPQDWDYLRSLPYLHVIDKLETLFVHAGIWPRKELWQQPNRGVCHVQLLHEDHFGQSKWWGKDRNGIEEDHWKELGWKRWYEVCDDPYLVVYGHNVYPEPFEYKRTLGIDTGCVFGGHLTAVVLPEKKFIKVKAKKTYFHDPRRQIEA